jgi:hypothetical protein
MTRKRYATRGRTWRLTALALGLALAGAACDDDPSGPDGGRDRVPESQLVFLRQAADAPALATYELEFVATAGQSTDVDIRYVPQAGEDSGEQFLRFRLENTSLFRYPADHPTHPGALFAPGDTVHIRITVDDSTLFRATFAPAGLEFNPVVPAELEFHYPEADRDYDEDGLEDPELETEIDLWRQETAGEDWERVGDVKDFDLEEIQARLLKFSRYGLAI